MQNLKYFLFYLLRKVPLFKGKTRLAKFITASYIKQAKNIDITGRHGIKYLIPNLVENIGFDLMLNGIYEPGTIDFIIKRIPRNGVFIDIGANIGAISLPVINQRTDITTVCIEASTRVYNYLQKNILSNNFTNVSMVNKAITEKDDTTLKFFSPEELFGKGSRAAVYTNDPEHVQTITLQSLYTSLNINRPSFVKVDVEGFEYDVFKGGEVILTQKNAPDIVFEFMEWAEIQNYSESGVAQKLLKQYGYHLYEIKENNSLVLIEKILTKDYAMILATKYAITI